MSDQQLEELTTLSEQDISTQNVIDDSPIGVFYTDEFGDWSYVNQKWCDITGLTANQANNEQWLKALHPDDRERCRKEWARARNHSQPYQSRHRYLHPDGQVHWAIVKAFPGDAKKTSKPCYIGTLTAVSGEMESYNQNSNPRQKLVDSSRWSSMIEFSTCIAHELNQPLTAINNYANGCLRRFGRNDFDQEEVAQVIEKIAAQAERAGDIISQLRQLIKKEKLRIEPCAINRTIKEALEFMGPNISTAIPNIELKLKDNLPEALIDKIQIEQVLINLIQNALEAMADLPEDKRRLTIETKQLDENHLSVTVIDIGRGLPENDIEKIFSSFYSTKTTGMGTGLAFCRSIIEAHGGKILARLNPSAGAIFEVQLPIKPKVANHES